MTTWASVDSIQQVEELVIHGLVRPGQTVVDVSAGGAEWIRFVVSRHTNIRALFYASPEVEGFAFGAAGAFGRSCPATAALGANLDADTRSQGIRHVHFLRIGQAGLVQRVLKGAAGLVRHSRIDYIQFLWNTHDFWTAEAVNKMLLANNYRLFTIECDQAGEVSLRQFSSWHTDRPGAVIHLLAAHERFMLTLTSNKAWSVDPWSWALGSNLGVTLKGLIHIGAHDGEEELRTIENLGMESGLLVEANPAVFERLEKNCRGKPGVIAVNSAILDRSGPVQFRLTDFDKSSSLLKLGTHRDLYPWVSECGLIEVEGITLDELLRTRNLNPARFNVMSLDIQGAELLALHGARETLSHIDLIFTEVSFEDLYEGCGQVDQVDDYLAQFGFRRVYTFTLECPAWADALYAKCALPVRALPGVPPFLYAWERPDIFEAR